MAQSPAQFKPAKRTNQWPWQRRTSRFARPTLLDNILLSPIKLLISLIYTILLALRGAPFKPPRNKPPIRIVCISDTHTNAGMAIPDGDLLIHAGDLTNEGKLNEIQKQIDWLDTLPHKEKIVICGNHDSYFDPSSRKAVDKAGEGHLKWPKNMHYLQHQSLVLKFRGGRKLKFYGSPDIPLCGGDDFAFQYLSTEAAERWVDSIPSDTDVLITHTPPKNHLDNALGCPGLLEEVWRVKPRLHVFGHVHTGHGRQAVWWDEGQAAYERVLNRKDGLISDFFAFKQWIDVLRVIWYSILGILRQKLMARRTGNSGGLMINAAMVFETTTNIGNPPEVVDL